MQTKNLWVIRPEPNFKNRLQAFLGGSMVAIGWPSVGNLSGGLDRRALSDRLRETYQHYQAEQKSELAVAAGVLDRFVNQIHVGDIILVPNGENIYLAKVVGPYEFHEDLSNEDPETGGYPHWHRVVYLNEGKPFCQVKDLPLGVRRSVDCRLPVFSIHSAAKAMWNFLGPLAE